MVRTFSNNNWNCPCCGELVPGNFSCCWNCGADERGNPDPHFISQNEESAVHSPQRSRLAGFIGLVIWTVTCCLLLVLATLLDKWLPVQWSLRIAGILLLFLLGLITGVIINVLAQAYPVLVDYLYPPDKTLVRIQDNLQRNPTDHES